MVKVTVHEHKECYNSGTDKLSKVKLRENYYVRYWNRNNSISDSSIAFKFDTDFVTLQAIHCKCSRSEVKGQGHIVKGQGHSVM